MSQHIESNERAEMLETLGKYCWAVDTGDVEALVGVFTADGVISFENGQRRENVRDFALRVTADGHLRKRMHLNHPLYFRCEGAQVILRSFIVTVRSDSKSSGGLGMSMSHTEDTFVRTDAGWRIKERAIFRWFGSS